MNFDREKLIKDSKEIRKIVLKMSLAAGKTGAHLGGSMSCIEILTVLFSDFIKLDRSGTDAEERDRFILSKGHAAPTYYAVLNKKGLISDELIETFKNNGSLLTGHPSVNEETAKLGIECSTGSLGQGISFAAGVAYALKLKKNSSSKVYVLLGDGECNEGSVWEAVMSAAHYKLDNLCIIIDKNQLQYDGKTEDVMNMGNLEEKFKAFGCETRVVDGHNVEELYRAFEHIPDEKPYVVIADTVKGKGVSFAEGVASWHHSILTNELYEKAIDELGD